MRTGVSSNTHMRAQSPGSRDAIERGCTCDPVKNCAGEGRRGASGIRLFVPDDECPLHGVEAVFGTSHRERRRNSQRARVSSTSTARASA